MKHLKQLINFLIITCSVTAFAQIRPMETTRLQSTAGAGVASILVNEAAFLNPAPIVFIPATAIYYQKGASSLDGESDNRSTEFSDGSNEVYLVSDASSQLKGTFSYQKQAENQFRRTRYTSSLASAIGKKTSLGIIYRYTIDEDIRQDDEKEFHQGVIGLSHIQSEKLSFGAVLVDPFLSNKEDARFIVGFQYSLLSTLVVIMDYGVNFNDDPHENTLVKGALQTNFFSDLYLRVGKYEDNILGLSGNSWGVSWIGPKLSLEYALKSSTVVSEKTDYLNKNEKLVESSLSIALVF